jgi:hypothetical protein
LKAAIILNLGFKEKEAQTDKIYQLPAFNLREYKEDLQTSADCYSIKQNTRVFHEDFELISTSFDVFKNRGKGFFNEKRLSGSLRYCEMHCLYSKVNNSAQTRKFYNQSISKFWTSWEKKMHPRHPEE